MLIGRIIGTVWATRKQESLEGLKLQIVRELDLELQPTPRFLIAADAVSAGVGDVVLIAQGSAARQAPSVEGKPVDALVFAVVDNLQVMDEAELEAAYAARRDPLLAQLEAQAEN